MNKQFNARLGGETKQTTIRAIAEPIANFAPYTARVRFEVKRNNQWIQTSLSAFNVNNETIALGHTSYFETLAEAEEHVNKIAEQALSPV